MNAVQGMQLRDAMTITGNTARTRTKKGRVPGHTEKSGLSSLLSQLPFFRLETWHSGEAGNGHKDPTAGALEQPLSGSEG